MADRCPAEGINGSCALSREGSRHRLAVLRMTTDRACRLLPILSPLVLAACQERGIGDPAETILPRFEMKGSCNAVLAIAPDAVQQDRTLDSNLERGLLNGVPVLVKDNIHVAGMPTTAGSLALLENIAEAFCFSSLVVNAE